MKACHFLMPTDWFEEIIRNWLQLVCTSFRIKWVNDEFSLRAFHLSETVPRSKSQVSCHVNMCNI